MKEFADFEFEQQSLNQRTYEPPGPVAEAFLRERLMVRFLMGPFGSGKTNTAFFDALTLAASMPVCLDGYRRFRGIVIRDLYSDLWETTIPSWHEWFPEEMGEWSGSKGRAATHRLEFEMADGHNLKFEITFRAMQDKSVESALRGIEFTWAFMNEADLLSEDVLTFLIGRAEQRRYPPMRLLPPSAIKINEDGEQEPDYFAGVIGDCNPPTVKSWIYRRFEREKPFSHRIFKQPSGRSPNGENRLRISAAAYERIAKANADKDWWVKRMVDGQYGYDRSGLPVYDAYQDDRHCAPEHFEPDPNLPLRLAFDQGVTGPAMLISQFRYNGQVRVLGEFAPDHRMGPTRFGQTCKAILRQRYSGFRIHGAVGDPAAFSGGDAEGGDLCWAETVSVQIGVPMVPAPTNELNPRIDAVKQLLNHFPDGQPALLISPECEVLREGFLSEYKLETKGEGLDRKIADKPTKNYWSNPQDGLQYQVLDIFGLDAVIAGEPGGDTGRRHNLDDDDEDDRRGGTVQVNADFDVFDT